MALDEVAAVINSLSDIQKSSKKSISALFKLFQNRDLNDTHMDLIVSKVNSLYYTASTRAMCNEEYQKQNRSLVPQLVKRLFKIDPDDVNNSIFLQYRQMLIIIYEKVTGGSQQILECAQEFVASADPAKRRTTAFILGIPNETIDMQLIEPLLFDPDITVKNTAWHTVAQKPKVFQPDRIVEIFVNQFTESTPVIQNHYSEFLFKNIDFIEKSCMQTILLNRTKDHSLFHRRFTQVSVALLEPSKQVFRKIKNWTIDEINEYARTFIFLFRGFHEHIDQTTFKELWLFLIQRFRKGGKRAVAMLQVFPALQKTFSNYYSSSLDKKLGKQITLDIKLHKFLPASLNVVLYHWRKGVEHSKFNLQEVQMRLSNSFPCSDQAVKNCIIKFILRCSERVFLVARNEFAGIIFTDCYRKLLDDDQCKKAPVSTYGDNSEKLVGKFLLRYIKSIDDATLRSKLMDICCVLDVTTQCFEAVVELHNRLGEEFMPLLLSPKMWNQQGGSKKTLNWFNATLGFSFIWTQPFRVVQYDQLYPIDPHNRNQLQMNVPWPNFETLTSFLQTARVAQMISVSQTESVLPQVQALLEENYPSLKSICVRVPPEQHLDVKFWCNAISKFEHVICLTIFSTHSLSDESLFQLFQAISSSSLIIVCLSFTVSTEQVNQVLEILAHCPRFSQLRFESSGGNHNISPNVRRFCKLYAQANRMRTSARHPKNARNIVVEQIA